MNHIKMLKAFVVMALLLCGSFAFAQKRTVSGRVLDSDKMPLGGITVMTSPTHGVITDDKGNFSISLPSGPAELEFVCLGYTTVKMTVQPSQDNLTVYMTEDALNLEEAVAVGYGVQKKVNLTGAVSTVTSKEISNRTSPTLTHMLQGSVPGLFVTTTNGSPDDVATINIRGYNSINGGTPLVLIDGVEGDMAKINPQDVESVSVLKDASSAAVYGARASFGVVLVTTKSGKNTGRPVVRYSGHGGVSIPTTRTDYERTGYWSVYINDLFYYNATGTKYTTYTDEDMEQLWIRRNDMKENPERPWVLQEVRNGKLSYIYYCNTDWYKEMFRRVNPFTQHNVSISGGTDKVKYYLSGGYEHKQGTFQVRPDKYNKYNMRGKFDFDINKYITISDNFSFFTSDYDYPGNSSYNYDFMYSFVHGYASMPSKNPDGTNVYKTIFTPGNVTNGCHIELADDLKKNKILQHNISNTVELAVRPIEGLEVKGNFTYTYNNYRKTNRWVPCTYSMYPGEILTEDYGRFQNMLEDTFRYTRYKALNVYASYRKTFNEKHNFSATAGYNYEDQYYRYIYTSGRNLSSYYLSEYNLVQPDPETGQKIYSVTGHQTEYALAGVFARANYDYKGKYLFEVSGRYDGTSRFAKDSRWGFFPSASVGWKVSDEPFFAPLRSFWDLAKVRFSYGALGNQQVSNYAYLRTVSTSGLSYLFESDTSLPNGSTVGSSSTDGLTWETTYHYNLGLDLGFFGNRLALGADAYIRDTKGMITSGEAVPSVYGASAPSANAANLRSKGIELTLSWKDTFNLAGKPFTYGIGLNYSDYVTKLTKYQNPAKVLGSYYEGMTFGEIWGFKTDGLFKSDAEAAEYTSRIDQSYLQGKLTDGWRGGDLKVKDLDGDGIISRGAYTVDDPGDLRVIGNSNPRFQYGINLSAQWLGFDLSVFLQGLGRLNWYPSTDNQAFWVCYNRSPATYIPKNYLDNVWSEDNTDAYFPYPRNGMAVGGTTYLTMKNDRYLQNLAYCRLKNLTFGYTLPDKVLSKTFVSNLRVYFTGENLCYLSPLTKISRYMDPEAMAKQSTFGYYYPYQRTFVFGVDITF